MAFSILSRSSGLAWLYLFILFLPGQLAYHYFWQPAWINGVRIDYLAIAIYFTDLLFFINLFIYRNEILSFLKKIYLLKLIFLFILLNLVFSLSWPITSYKLLRIFQWFLIYSLFSHTKLNLNLIIKLFLLGGALELLLSLMQMTRSSSLQGIFYWIGERAFTISTPGIAKITFDNIDVLRPYGTFSHPNSLAGFYLLIYTFILYRWNEVKIWLRTTSQLLFWVLILFTFSKGAILALMILQSIFLIKSNRGAFCKPCFWGRIITLMLIGTAFMLGQSDLAADSKRIFLLISSLNIFLAHWWQGTGAGAYLLMQAEIRHGWPHHFLQPVHNIFLLILSELGIILYIFIFYYLFNFFKKHNKLIFIVLPIIITGMFDHYWWTISQNFYISAVIIGLSTNNRLTS